MRKAFGSGVCALGLGFRVARVLLVLLFVFSLVGRAVAQMETATLSGTVTDPTGAVVAGAEVRAVRIDTATNYVSTTNTSGLYLIVGLQPGRFRIFVTKQGFKQIQLTDVTLNVQETVSRNFSLEVGAASETVTVRADDLHINTTDATVSTVVDRQFAENLPMTGRSFQTLIELTPGVVVVPSNSSDSGQFSINGQRAVSNYWMVDGVSANIGISTGQFPGNGFGGALGSFSALGGTNSLVSVDALQEFRIQTSTYAPEFGRTPGGQISIVTRSGTNQFHGSAFDYLRNDVFDANNWFNGVNILNATPIPKAKERQNDFGGTFGGPILKEKTFFFFSYEGLRLRLPQTSLTTVPDLAARQNAVPAMQPFLNAYPFDPKQPELGNGIAQYNASYSNPATLDAYSLRVDHKLTNKWSLFGRYNYSPSQIAQRGNGGVPLSTVSVIRITTQTATAGATWIIAPTVTNDLRFNYSRTNADSHAQLDNFGGAVPLSSLPFPSPFTSQNAFFGLTIFSLPTGALQVGQFARNLQRQINVVDSLSMQKGSHSLKFGVDFRRLSPQRDPNLYAQEPFFGDVPSAENGTLLFSAVFSSVSATYLFRDLGIYAQDTWRIVPRLTLTYGLRWDLDYTPKTINGPSFPAVTGFDLSNLSGLALAPAGTPPYKTTYGNFAPRVGLAYQLRQRQDWQTVLRGGFGVFYDLATSEAGNSILFPFMRLAFSGGGTFPLSPAAAAPPAITPEAGIIAFDPRLKLPYTLEWNIALEQALGKQQIVSASYIGAAGRRLLQTAAIPSPNVTFGSKYPGRKALNPVAFTHPATNPAGCDPAVTFPCAPARQGTLGRNALRGFGATQWDFAVHREFPIHESLKLQFRAEMFNVLNHPNFGPPSGGWPFPPLAMSTQILAQSLSGGNLGAGAFSPLYQIGGPRSIQLALKLQF